MTKATFSVIDNLAAHPFFEPWVDPQSGAQSFILKKRVAPFQEPFYFVNSGLSPDERWLWFYAGFPPSPHRSLAVVSLDSANPSIRHFPGANFSCASPMVAPEGDACYYCLGPTVWRQPLSGEAEAVCSLDEKWINHRPIHRLATHLTLSADGHCFLLDGAIGEHWFVATGNRHSGEVKMLHEFPTHHNHAQFSPVDPDLFLIAQDWWRDQVSGQYFCYDQRTWLMDVGQTRFEPITPTAWYGHGTLYSHEWWSADGDYVCWQDYETGAFEYNIRSHAVTQVWEAPICHAHCDAPRRYWVADLPPYQWGKDLPFEVRFFDRQTGRSTGVATALPVPPWPAHTKSAFYFDPHPRFSPQDTCITYTTTVRGQVDVALAPVAQMKARVS